MALVYCEALLLNVFLNLFNQKPLKLKQIKSKKILKCATTQGRRTNFNKTAKNKLQTENRQTDRQSLKKSPQRSYKIFPTMNEMGKVKWETKTALNK